MHSVDHLSSKEMTFIGVVCCKLLLLKVIVESSSHPTWQVESMQTRNTWK